MLTAKFASFGSGGNSGPSSPAISTPRVVYVETDGNDTTGDGSLGAPYRLASKAVREANAAYVADGTKTHIQLGVGNFGELNTSPAEGVTMQGCGHTMTFIDSVASNGNIGFTGGPGGNGGNIHMDAPGICILGNISALGGDAGTGFPEMSAGNGGNGGNVIMHGVKFDGDIIVTGGAGGGAGTDGTGGNGGNGGIIALRDCVTAAYGNFSFAGGAPGGGASPGTAGTDGYAVAFRSELKMPFPSASISLIDCITVDNGSATVYGGAVYPAL